MKKDKQNKIPDPGDMKYLQDTLYVISAKWRLPVLYSLAQGNQKFREVQRSIPGITAKMLARELRELEQNGFIQRKHPHDFTTVYAYEVTGYCKSFETIIAAMIDWGKKHRNYIRQKGQKANTTELVSCKG